MNRSLFLVLTLLVLSVASPLPIHAAVEANNRHDVVIYNVENLFDADGLAVYDDYALGAPGNPYPYTPQKVLTKLRNITTILKTFADGQGPDIILFQGFELDRTPASTVEDYQAFLKRWTDTTVEEMLTRGFNEEVAGLPAEALLLKYCQEQGLNGYEVALPLNPAGRVRTPAHNCVVFSRLPIVEARSYPLERARDILEVHLERDGHRLILLNNHWKSGASSPQTEPVRLQNATILRHRLNELLALNPHADIIIGGDLNSYYNQLAHFPELGRTGVNTILRSQGDELAIRNLEGPDLYNLWYERPLPERRSELYHGGWGTLMQVLLTRGLYDQAGFRYVDNSFRVISLPGLNAHPVTGEPLSWHFSGQGGGFSDHFPIAFEIRYIGPGQPATYTELQNPSRVQQDPREIPHFDYSQLDVEDFPAFAHEKFPTTDDLTAAIGDFFRVEGHLVKIDPMLLLVEGRVYELYSWKPEVMDRLRAHGIGSDIRLAGQFGEYRASLQFVIPELAWLEEPPQSLGTQPESVSDQPKAVEEPAAPVPGLTIVIRAQNDYLVNGKPLSPGELAAKLKSLAGADSALPVLVRVPGDLPMKSVYPVMSLLDEVGLRSVKLQTLDGAAAP